MSFLLECACTLGVVFMRSCAGTQVLDCDKAQMSAWLCDVVRVRPQEASVISAALLEKCGKICAV